MTKEKLEVENASLRAQLAQAGIEARHASAQRAESDDRHRADLASSREQTSRANQRVADARAETQDVVRTHDRRMADVSANLAVSEDLIAELRASQLALASSEARQRAIFDSAIDVAMVITDPAGIITDWTPVPSM